jgi:multicomponent Na+:H+ antiporter subunit E
MMGRYLNNILLALAWAVLTGSFTLANFAFGLLLSAAALYLASEKSTAMRNISRLAKIFSLSALFVRELVLSGWRVARLVTSRHMIMAPGIFSYTLKVDTDFQITLLANLITLTPGTLSVDVSKDRRLLFVHAIDCSDVEAARRDIEQGFERKIIEAFGT